MHIFHLLGTVQPGAPGPFPGHRPGPSHHGHPGKLNGRHKNDIGILVFLNQVDLENGLSLFFLNRLF